MTVYTIEYLRKIYGSRTVLDISKLDIAEQQIYALVGPNGAGKTTLLNILGFLDPPTSGQVRYYSQPVRFTGRELQRLRKQVIIVDQFPILFTTSVYKNLEFGLKIRKIGKAKRVHMIEEALELVGMREFSDAQAHLLSGGETQRVALARALVLSPRVLLCDEPTSSVDIEHQNLIINILRQINAEKRITVVFTTHDRSQAVSLAHQILVLDQGRLVPAVYDNIFTGILHPEQTGYFRCTIHDLMSIVLPSDQIKGCAGKVRVFIDPEKINLFRTAGNQTNMNAMQGRVIQVMEQNRQIRVVLDAGIWLTILMVRDEYSRLQPRVGETIAFHIPSEAVQRI